ncbi:MAG: SMP-30/gluconolactonase/LRE family protein [Hyphomonadaceae bacterium]|nr:SMP-30/gluconolactonase/LRE family protein [Hyphomonadaceae bacterium]
MITAELIAEVETGDTLGEGIVWDARRGAFIWADILGRRLHVWTLDGARLETRDVPHRLCSLSLTRDPGIIIAAFDKGIAAYNIESGALSWLHQPDLSPGERFNDGRTGPDGRFWVGTMVEDAEAAGGTDKGALYSLDKDGGLRQHFSGIHISNGLCWSPDATRLYHADSPKLRVKAYPFDAASGVLGEPANFIGKEHLTGGPDGAVCDAAGLYWSAVWGGSCVSVFAEDGAPLGKIDIPAPHVTCPCFGGPELDILAVTTARAELSEDQLQAAPRSGNLFVYKTAHTGQPTQLWGGKV